MSYQSNYYVRKTNKLAGGLTVQLVNRHTENGQLLKDCDFNHSLILSEDAFLLVEPIFIQHSSLATNTEKWAYYHYGFHIHNRNQVQMILLDLSTLLNQYEVNQIDEQLEIGRHKMKIFKAIISFLKNNLNNLQYYGIYVCGI